jgi:ATP/maltotriose-dependent transcriptional regulator MalT
VFLCAQAVFNLGDYDQAAQLLDRIGGDVSTPEDPDMVAGASLLRGFMASAAGDFDTCERELRRALELVESWPGGGLDWAAAYTHNGIGQLLAVRGDIDGAIGEFTRSQELGHQAGNVGAQMQSLVFEANLHLMSGRRDRARELGELDRSRDQVVRLEDTSIEPQCQQAHRCETCPFGVLTPNG